MAHSQANTGVLGGQQLHVHVRHDRLRDGNCDSVTEIYRHACIIK